MPWSKLHTKLAGSILRITFSISRLGFPITHLRLLTSARSRNNDDSNHGTLTVEDVFLVDKRDFHHGLPAVPLPVGVTLSPPVSPIERARSPRDYTRREHKFASSKTRANESCIRICDGRQESHGNTTTAAAAAATTTTTNKDEHRYNQLSSTNDNYTATSNTINTTNDTHRNLHHHHQTTARLATTTKKK